ncbi:hypothetical protein ANN_01472 [Periplaneta americana]|uniref:Uncharacterized protein n=1 Tax=Periplaneta americana TaxID=6978 RepID=A0ABQ8TWN3_PERAM|nr:hypothetical protein ANN_01472 [Periplaneta americana]
METFGHVLGFCRKTELLRNNRHHKARTVSIIVPPMMDLSHAKNVNNSTQKSIIPNRRNSNLPLICSEIIEAIQYNKGNVAQTTHSVLGVQRNETKATYNELRDPEYHLQCTRTYFVIIITRPEKYMPLYYQCASCASDFEYVSELGPKPGHNIGTDNIKPKYVFTLSLSILARIYKSSVVRMPFIRCKNETGYRAQILYEF